MIKLIATDLDGTLVDERGQIAQDDVEALDWARERGVTVVVATGRMPETLGDFLQRLHVREHEPVVGGQGAVVARRDGSILHMLTIPRYVAEQGAAIARAHDAVPVFYAPGMILMERVAFSREEDPYWLGQHLRYDPNALNHLPDEIIKLIAVQPDAQRAEALLQAFREALGDRAEVVRSHHWFVEAVHPRATKGNAIAWIARQLGIGREQVLAIGDAGNDVSMLTWAGIGVAPGDATPEARAAADWIGPSQAEHVVAAAVERFVR